MGTEDDGKVFNYTLLSLRGVRIAAGISDLTLTHFANHQKLRRGSYGPLVKKLQAAFELTAYGYFGPGTQREKVSLKLATLAEADYHLELIGKSVLKNATILFQ